ncbi:MAG: hypothetical protein LUQ18_10065 [Methylococcaceae bacterium]|nr:hypothetical protein [Methylococcaceae bacterium]
MNGIEMAIFMMEFNWKFLTSGLLSIFLGMAGIAALVFAARRVLRNIR